MLVQVPTNSKLSTMYVNTAHIVRLTVHRPDPDRKADAGAFIAVNIKCVGDEFLVATFKDEEELKPFAELIRIGCNGK